MARAKQVKLFQRGEHYWVRYTDANGQQQRDPLGTTDRATAEKKCDEIAFALKWNRAEQGGPTGAVPTFFQFIGNDETPGPYLTWFKAQYPSSYQRVEGIMRVQLVPYFGRYPLSQITSSLVTTWMTNRLQQFSRHLRFDGTRTKVKRATVNKEFRQLKAALYKAVKLGMIHAHPWKSGAVEQFKETDSKQVQFYELDELHDILEASGEHRWWWQLYVSTGMRKAEGLHLRSQDIRGGMISIVSREDEGERTKSGKARYVPVNDDAQEALSHLGKDGYVLPRLHTNSFSRAFRRDVGKANKARAKRGLRPLSGSLHCLRHTFCSHLAMNGVDVATIQALAGHAEIKTTMRYMHLSPTHLQNALKSTSFAKPQLKLVKSDVKN